MAGAWHLVNKPPTDAETPTPTMHVSPVQFVISELPSTLVHIVLPHPVPWKLQAVTGPLPCSLSFPRKPSPDSPDPPQGRCQHLPGSHARPKAASSPACHRRGCPADPHRRLPRPLPRRPHPRVLAPACAALGLPALWNAGCPGSDLEAALLCILAQIFEPRISSVSNAKQPTPYMCPITEYRVEVPQTSPLL